MTSQPDAQNSSALDPHTKITSLVSTEVVVREIGPGYYPDHRDPGYRPWLKTYGPREPTRHERIVGLMTKHLNQAVIASKVCFIFALSFATDYMLPKAKSEVEITVYDVSKGGTRQLTFSDGRVANVSKKMMRQLKGKHLTIYRTRIFGIPYQAADRQNNIASFEIAFYGNFIFMPLALFATSLVGVLRRKGTEFRFNLGVASAALALFNIAFLHIHKF